MVGQGGEGEVWEARDSRGRRCALKLIRPAYLADEEAVAQRGRWLRRIDHPNLVRVHRSGMLRGGSLDGWGMVEMDLVEGVPLDRAPADPHACERLRPLAQALDLLHAGRWSDGVPLVHRDVKPANLIDTGDRMVLVDPSTLRGVDATQLTRVGTPVFAAPEVLTGRITPAADVYSFAATAVALSTGLRGAALADVLEVCAGGWGPVEDADGRLWQPPPGVCAGLAAQPRARPPSCRWALDPAFAPVAVWQPGGSREPDLPGARERTGVLDPNGEALAAQGAGPPAPRRCWPWLAALAAMVGAPVAVAAGGPGLRSWFGAVLLGAVALHLVAMLAAGVPPVVAVLAPPYAWADVLARRAAATRRRQAYARAMAVGAFAVPVAVLLAAGRVADTGPEEPAVAAAAAAVVALATAAVVATTAAGLPGLLLRLTLAPLWLCGATLVLAGGVVAWPLAALAGGGRRAIAVPGWTLLSCVEIFRAPTSAAGPP